MKKRNAQRKWQKITRTERFSLFQSAKDPTVFEVSWKKSNGYGRRRFNAESVESTLKKAPVFAGLEAGRSNPRQIKISDAFEMALKSASSGKTSRGDWFYWVERFVGWLDKNYPNHTHWHMLTRPIIREYLSNFVGKSTYTKKHAVQPVEQASRFMYLDFGFTDFAANLGISTKLEASPKAVYLADLVEFVDFLKKLDSGLEVGACLLGLAGLRLQEATQLRWNRVDTKQGLIEISGKTKNEYSNRVIPVCGRVIEALERAYNQKSEKRSKIQEVRSYVLIEKEGLGYTDWRNYSKEMRNSLKSWNPRIDWKPKDLRNCLPTFAVTKGLLNDVWEQYIGHAPRTITARHYIPRLASVSYGEKDALERQMDLFRLQVVEPLEEAIVEKSEVKILNFFEQSTSDHLISSK